MGKLIITRGLPASGKTTWAKAWVDRAPEKRARVNRDDLRMQLFGKYEGLTFKQEQILTEVSRAMVKTLLSSGLDVVADDMNLRPKYVSEWHRFAKANGHELEVQTFEISIAESKIRNRDREFHGERFVHGPIIESMKKYLGKGEKLLPVQSLLEEPVQLVKYEHDWALPSAYIVDIDGTVALNTGGRSFYDMTRVHEDTKHELVVRVVEALYNNGDTIIFLSGRDESGRELTENWLKQWVPVQYAGLYMRPAGDMRKDSIVKRELFDEHIRGKYNVLGVLDDRKQVVKMWREELGLLVLHVDEGDH